MWTSKPLFDTLAGAWAPWFMILGLHIFLDIPVTDGLIWTPVAFLAGFFYTQMFEYVYHRFPMHINPRGTGSLSRIHEIIRNSHIEHHRAFPRSRFTMDQTTLGYSSHQEMGGIKQPMNELVVMRWWAYPVLFGLHYLPMILFLPGGFVVMFLLGTVVHYNIFETSHWYTHVSPNWLNPFLAKIPIVGYIRRRNIEIHRQHHETPNINFNFTPPYAGDKWLKTFDDPDHAAKI